MSINVTVTGNPVCIKRGKMVTVDPKDVHKEFQKRRKIRLEQVRQQSKEIAESVRNKVKREKSKQLSNIDKQGAVKFSEWQNNKLLELQGQYRESLKDIGLGHTQAKIEEAEETDFIERRDKCNEETAHNRGLVAEQQEQIHKNEESLKKALPIQTRRMARDIEDARSAMISKMKHTPKKKRKKSLVNVSITKDVSDSDDVEFVDIIEDSESSKSSKMTEFRDIPIPSVRTQCNSDRFSPISSPRKRNTLHSQLQTKSRDNSAENQKNKSPPGSPKEKHKLSHVTVTDASFEYPFDTRISDRIKNRKIIDSRILSGLPLRNNEISESSSEDFKIGSYQQNSRTCKSLHKEVVEVDIHKPSSGRTERNKCLGNCSTQINLDNNCAHSHCNNVTVQTDGCKNKCACFKENKCTCKTPQTKKVLTQTSLDKHKTSDLPSKPTISIRSGVSEVNDKKEYTRVQYYDHDNRFSKDYIVDGSHVQKISEESIQVCANDESDSNFQQMTFHREKVAEMRGKKALEKEKIQRDYEVLLQKLPVLQKQDRIASLDPSKDKHHMSEKRLKEFEKHRQHKIETAFEKLIPNTITIQPKQSTENVESPLFKAVDVENKNKEKNLEWKSATNVLTHTNSKTSKENLKILLEKLKTQKAILMQEDTSLPQNSNLYNLISDLEKCQRKSSKSTSTTTSSSSLQKHHSKGKQKFKKCSGTPKRKPNIHKDVLVLQNTSTQTSPKIEKPNIENKTCNELNNDKNINTESKKDDKKCECPDGDDKICEILIKIQENEKPEILISSPKDKKGIVSIDVQKVQESHPPEVKKPSPKKEKKAKRKEQVCSDPKKTDLTNIRSKHKSDNGSFWREQLSKNDTTNITNSSTSYYSPPDYSKESENGNICSILQKKPQQSNICGQPKQTRTLNPDLLAYIQKLLEMSKGSIEDLCISSVSEVSTPTSSIIETQKNMNPAQKLINLLKHLNINIDNRVQKNNLLSKKNQTDPEISGVTSSNKSNSQYSNAYNGSQSYNSTPFSSTQRTCRDISEPDFPENVLVKNITEITDKCQDKINKLTAKINTLRAEKIQIISPTNSSGSDKENMTSYLNLPSMLIQDANSARSTSPEQEELNRKLLQVDTSKMGTVDEANDLFNRLTESVNRGEFNDVADGDIVDRYIKLFTAPMETNNEDNSVPFVPVLMDIPKLPKFSNVNQEKKPPPAKGFNIARKYNNIDMVPHELSTIPEADSMRRSKSPDTSKTEEHNNIVQELLKSSRNSQSTNSSQTDSPKNFTVLNKIPQIHSPKLGDKNKELSKVNNLIDGKIMNVRESPEFMSTPKSQHSPPTFLQALPISKKSSPKSRKSPNSPSKSNKQVVHSPDTRTYSISPRPEKQANDDLYINPRPGPSRDIPKSEDKKLNTVELIQIIKKLKDVSTDSSTDKSEDVESMLRSIGMDWAVATLKKTQEALARESSSSSSNSKLASSSTDLSLKDSQSSSTTKSSNSNFLQENFQDISAIQGSNLSAEKQQRTSTPVQTTKSSDKSKSNSGKDKIFTGESDLSSVKEKSKDNEWNFISIPDYTANDSTTMD